MTARHRDGTMVTLMFMRARIGWCLAVFVLAGVSSAHAAEQARPTLDVLLAGAGDGVLDFVAKFSNVVAQEQYFLTWRGFRRQLNSDFLLIQPKDVRNYFAFRDVLTVDGKPVRSGDRLMKLLLEPSANAFARAAAISKEGARYTFGNFFSSPIDVLIFIQPIYQPRFQFTLTGIDTDIGPGVWEVRYVEQTRPTILRGTNDRDVVATGRFWIEADTARIVKTELTLRNASVVTSFQFDDRLKINVPVEMISRYRYQNDTVLGTATYGHFRRFGVTTEENLAK